MDELRDRIAAAITGVRIQRDGDAHQMADAVIAELDLGNPCATTGCRMRQIARRHAENSSRLEADRKIQR